MSTLPKILITAVYEVPTHILGEAVEKIEKIEDTEIVISQHSDIKININGKYSNITALVEIIKMKPLSVSENLTFISNYADEIEAHYLDQIRKNTKSDHIVSVLQNARIEMGTIEIDLDAA